MTIHRERGHTLVECDGCDEVLRVETVDFDVVSITRREAGWAAVKECGEWMHLCPDCT